MARTADRDRLTTALSVCTLAWLAVYIPLETYVTWSIAGIGGLLYSGYVLNVVGMALMMWGARSTMKRVSTGPAVLAIGWSWTAATFWRATSERFRWASAGQPLYAGPIELWLAPLLTALAVAGLGASMVLIFRRQHLNLPSGSRQDSSGQPGRRE